MTKKVTFKNNKKQKLVGILNVPKGKPPFPAVVLCHGLSSNSGGYRIKIAQQLRKLKIASLRFDLSGHGQSQGKFVDVTVSQGIKDIESAIKYLKDIKEVDHERIGLMGTSLSGVQAQFVASKDKKLKALVLFAPATDFLKLRLERWKKQKLEDWEKNGFIWYKPKMKLNYSFHLDSIKKNGFKVASKIKTPTLLIQGEKDDIVRVSMSKKFFSLLRCPKKLVIIKGGGHAVTGTFYEDRVVKLNVSWFKKYI